MALRRFQNQEAAHVSLIGRCRFFDALKDAVAAQQEQIQNPDWLLLPRSQPLSAHLIAHNTT